MALTLGILAGSAVFAFRGDPGAGSSSAARQEPPPIVADPFPIELEQPIPEPGGVDPIPSDPFAEGAPVAFPGYLLPGDGEAPAEGEGRQEDGDERP